MSLSDNRNDLREAPAPERQFRLRCWFGIYFAGVLLFSIQIMLHNQLDLGTMLAPFLFSLIFPCGFMGLPHYLPIPAASLQSPFLKTLIQVVALGLVPLGYGTYAIHLKKTLNAKTLRAFRFWLIGLVVIVALNLTGCYGFLSESAIR